MARKVLSAVAGLGSGKLVYTKTTRFRAFDAFGALGLMFPRGSRGQVLVMGMRNGELVAVAVL